ncbi:MAG: rod shape-determining protein MreC [Parcubacteria group bacterium Licking1014_1]|nr:MAG: rod shape-determining protein MreC [Parcubacteria group bacterium Licking1014_1]
MDISLNKQKIALLKILIAIFALFVVFGDLNLFQSQIKNSFYFMSGPIEKIFWRAGENASAFFISFLSAGNLARENESLKNENQKLLSELFFLQETDRKNQELFEMSASNQKKEFNLVQAGIIGLDDKQDIISIDKGSVDGILEGMPVINTQKALFGKVLKAYENFSKIMLISNNNNVLDVKIKQDDTIKTPIYGVIKGKGGLGIYLDLIPIDSEIKEGDILVTSSLEDTFPKNLLVGKITSKDKNDQKPFQKAKVEPFFDIKTIDNLFVITDYKREN